MVSDKHCGGGVEVVEVWSGYVTNNVNKPDKLMF